MNLENRVRCEVSCTVLYVRRMGKKKYLCKETV